MSRGCDRLFEVLEDLLEGRVAGSDRLEAESHLVGCAACRELVEAARGQVAPPAGLVGRVMARTAGSPCRSARERLPDHVDGGLEPLDGELVAGHLRTCGECRCLEGALRRLGADLPLLAEAAPGSGFFAAVLARTTGAPSAAPVGAGRPPSLPARLSAALERLARRPRIAWEGAYLGAVALVLAMGLPTSPLAGVPGRALEVVDGNPVLGLGATARRLGASALAPDGPATRVIEPAARLESRVSGTVRSLWERADLPGRARGLWEAARAGEAFMPLGGSEGGEGGWVERLREGLGTLTASRASGEEKDDDQGLDGTDDRAEGDER